MSYSCGTLSLPFLLLHMLTVYVRGQRTYFDRFSKEYYRTVWMSTSQTRWVEYWVSIGRTSETAISTRFVLQIDSLLVMSLRVKWRSFMGRRMYLKNGSEKAVSVIECWLTRSCIFVSLGSLGAVYSGEGPGGMPVAIKFININDVPINSMKLVETYLNEVALLQRLRQESLHVVVIYDFDFDSNTGIGKLDWL